MDDKRTRDTIILTEQVKLGKDLTISDIFKIVYDALDERGYNAIDQISGYLLSGDPTYITSHNNARALIKQLERDDIAEELVRAYLHK